MAKGKELQSKAFLMHPRFNYLPAEDRYLFAVEPPRYKFNVIGAGINGCEHIRVTLLEGRATVVLDADALPPTSGAAP